MWILIGDLHLTDQARDAYRFGIFDWIKQQQAHNPVAATFLAGDITDAKDRHSATLVNKIVSGLTKLKPPVYICMGNHDYRDPGNPFFKFLNHIDGIKFVTKPKLISHGRHMAVIPHYRGQDDFNAAIALVGHIADSFLVHQTFEGAIAESGVRLTGLSASPIELLKPRLGVYAGDVHKPQKQGIVTYVGCPYQIRFGDSFEPRVLFINEEGKKRNLYFPAPRKWSLTIRDSANIINNKDLCEGDQVKLTIEMAREEAIDWKKTRAEVLAVCREMKLDVYGVKLEIRTTKRRERIKVTKNNKEDIFDTFCKEENIATSIKEVGRKILLSE